MDQLRENTVGFVIFRRDGLAIKYLQLHKRGEYWSFPKGHQEAGEGEVATAKRELVEETGITSVKIISGFKAEYDFDFDTIITDGLKKTVYKHAIFFLGEVADDKVIISDEHLDFGWFDFETAKKRAFYQDGQNVLQQANDFLLKQQDFVL